MNIRDMIRADGLAVEFYGTARRVMAIAVGRGLPAGRWRAYLLSDANAPVSVSAWRRIDPTIPQVGMFDLDPPVPWETARACHVGFERDRARSETND